MIRMLAIRWPICALVLLLAASSANAAGAGDHRRLQYEQQQDALNLRMQQSLRARRQDLAPADAQRLNQLQLQQRLEQHQLEIQQVQRDRALRQSGSIAPEFRDRTLDAQRELFAQERQLQIQRTPASSSASPSSSASGRRSARSAGRTSCNGLRTSKTQASETS